MSIEIRSIPYRNLISRDELCTATCPIFVWRRVHAGLLKNVDFRLTNVDFLSKMLIFCWRMSIFYWRILIGLNILLVVTVGAGSRQLARARVLLLYDSRRLPLPGGFYNDNTIIQHFIINDSYNDSRRLPLPRGFLLRVSARPRAETNFSSFDLVSFSVTFTSLVQHWHDEPAVCIRISTSTGCIDISTAGGACTCPPRDHCWETLRSFLRNAHYWETLICFGTKTGGPRRRSRGSTRAACCTPSGQLLIS